MRETDESSALLSGEATKLNVLRHEQSVGREHLRVADVDAIFILKMQKYKKKKWKK